MINIEGLNKAEVLRDLYNASKVQGLGFMSATGRPMTTEEAATILTQTTDFDYLYGKVMKINLASDIEFEEWLYDRDNGPGAAKNVIGWLRQKTEADRAYKHVQSQGVYVEPATGPIPNPHRNRMAASGCEASYLDD